MTFEREWFITYKSIVARKVYMGDDTILEAIGKGNIKATMQVGGKMLLTTITQFLHVPKMKNSLISINKPILEGLKVEFDKDGCKVNNVHGTIVAQAQREKNLYLLNVNVRKETANVAKSSNEGAMFWHQRPTFIDNFSRKTHFYLLKAKGEVFDKFNA